MNSIEIINTFDEFLLGDFEKYSEANYFEYVKHEEGRTIHLDVYKDRNIIGVKIEDNKTLEYIVELYFYYFAGQAIINNDEFISIEKVVLVKNEIISSKSTLNKLPNELFFTLNIYKNPSFIISIN